MKPGFSRLNGLASLVFSLFPGSSSASRWCGMTCKTAAATILTGLLLFPFAGLPADGDQVVDNVFKRQAELSTLIRDATYTGESVSEELTDQGIVKKKTVAVRQVLMKGEKERSEYLRVAVDGKELTPAQIRRETAAWSGGKRGNLRERMPFVPAFRGTYSYTVTGKRTYRGMDVWVVHFTPLKKEIGYLDGDAYILDRGFEIVGLDFLPARTFFAVKNMKFSLEYGRTADFWLPSLFSMDLEVQLKAVVNLAHLIIRVRETYGDYRINTGIPDSRFRTDGNK